MLVSSFDRQHLLIRHMNRIVYEGVVGEKGVVGKGFDLKFSFPILGCRREIIELDISISDPKIPRELMLNSLDSRMLGIGIMKIHLN